MSQLTNMRGFRIVLLLILLSSLASLADVKQVSANPGTMTWTAIDTPSPVSNVIVSPSEINFIAIGYDDNTFYAVDIPDLNSAGSLGRLYKSLDGGVTWPQELSAQLTAAGAFMPVWNFAVAPDDVNFIVAVTDGTGGLTPSGPTQVYISTDGGATWQNTSFTAVAAGELISCVDISVTYGGTTRDIAIGTRTGTGAGRVYVMESTGFATWADQNLPQSDVVALKFSPTYPSDNGFIAVSSDTTGTWLHLGTRDTPTNTTPSWDAAVAGGFPVQLWDYVFAPPNSSPNFSQIITADLELPSDFSAQDVSLRRFYVSTDATDTSVQVGIYRIDDTVPHRISPPTTSRISSIAYYGTYAGGVLLAGEVTADPALGLANVWRTVNCTDLTPAWLKSDTYKSPTGGGNSSYANAQLAWNQDGTRAYCGTSSANPTTGGTGAATGWPFAWLTSFTLDESAFSVSPYSRAYSQQLAAFNKTEDTNIGNVWNQLSLIDTEIGLLSDDAALGAPETGENLATVNYDILYVFSISDNTTVTVNFDSLWRSTSNPLGRTWERVLCIATSGTDTILRVKQTTYEETDRSDVIVFAERGTEFVGISANEGQAWDIRGFTTVTDLALASDTIIYILNNRTIYKYEKEGTGWVLRKKVSTDLDAGHTIAVPLKNPPQTGGLGTEQTEDMVLVGEVGPPYGLGRIAYADFSQLMVTVNPPISERIAPPVAGDAHVIFDDKFEQNSIIYNAVHDLTDGSGKIYRWVIGKSTAWDELEPPNTAFYGLVQRNDVLYGAWKTYGIPETAAQSAGVDRTLYPRASVPPPPEWDYLIQGLPTAVVFNREPSSLKISSNEFNSLWAIDNRNYNFANQVGCLWEYTDTISKVGPWTTAPPSGSDIPVDPTSGRAVEVNFAWRSLSNITAYELQVAKDIDFNNRVLVSENITVVDQLAPEVFLPAGSLIPASGSNIGSWGNLESGHTYYWRVRGRGAITGEIARSPWSATMYFTVEGGLPIASPYPTINLFSPMYGARDVSTAPAFSWSKMPGTTEYEFILAKDADLQQVVVKVHVPTTSYLYDGKLDYDTGYFWQVRAIEPVASDPSPTGTFTVIAEQKPVAPAAKTAAPIPSWVWWIIAVFTALVGVIIAFTMVKPSSVRPGGGKLFKVEPIVDKPKSPIVDKPKNPIAKIWESVIMAGRRRRYLKKISDSEVEKPKNPIAKIWESIIMANRRRRYLKKISDIEPQDSKSEDSREKLT